MERYSRTAATFHWLVALLFLVATGLALFRETFAPWAIDMISAHKVAGLAILLLTAAQIAFRMRRPPPPLTSGLLWERRLARLVHASLYVLLLAVPIAGWIFVSLAPDSRPLDYRGRENVPELPLAPDDVASFAWHEVHEIAGFVLLFLFAVHLAGVIRHQLRPGDAVLPRMLSGRAWRDFAAWAAFAGLALWSVGLALDFLGVRLMG